MMECLKSLSKKYPDIESDLVKSIVKYIRDQERKEVTPSITSIVESMVSSGYSIRDVLRAISKMEESGIIDLVEIAPRDFKEYLRSPFSLDLWFVLSATLGTILIVLVFGITQYPLVTIRYVLGTIFVLFIPGFSLIQCLYYRREDLDDLERFALSIGLSLALVPLVGLVLNYTPFGIRLPPVTISLSILSIILIVCGTIRRYRYLKTLS